MKMHCSNLAADALQIAIDDYLSKRKKHRMPNERVVVAMSGGVDLRPLPCSWSKAMR